MLVCVKTGTHLPRCWLQGCRWWWEERLGRRAGETWLTGRRSALRNARSLRARQLLPLCSHLFRRSEIAQKSPVLLHKTRIKSHVAQDERHVWASSPTWRYNPRNVRSCGPRLDPRLTVSRASRVHAVMDAGIGKTGCTNSLLIADGALSFAPRSPRFTGSRPLADTT